MNLAYAFLITGILLLVLWSFKQTDAFQEEYIDATNKISPKYFQIKDRKKYKKMLNRRRKLFLVMVLTIILVSLLKIFNLF